MRHLFIFLALAAVAQASFAGLFYSTGDVAGIEVERAPNFVGAEQICFKGSTAKAAEDLWALFSRVWDMEQIYVSVDHISGHIRYGYIRPSCVAAGRRASQCRKDLSAAPCRRAR